MVKMRKRQRSSCQRIPPTSYRPPDFWTSRTFLLRNGSPIARDQHSQEQASPTSPLPQAHRQQGPRAPQEHPHVRACSLHPGPAPKDPSASRGMCPRLNTSSTCNVLCLRVELFSGGPGEVGPGHVAPPEVVGAVGCVPGVVAAGPGQGAREGRAQVVESPGDDGVVVEGDVEANDANGKADAWG